MDSKTIHITGREGLKYPQQQNSKFDSRNCHKSCHFESTWRGGNDEGEKHSAAHDRRTLIIFPWISDGPLQEGVDNTVSACTHSGSVVQLNTHCYKFMRAFCSPSGQLSFTSNLSARYGKRLCKCTDNTPCMRIMPFGCKNVSLNQCDLRHITQNSTSNPCSNMLVSDVHRLIPENFLDDQCSLAMLCICSWYFQSSSPITQS